MIERVGEHKMDGERTGGRELQYLRWSSPSGLSVQASHCSWSRSERVNPEDDKQKRGEERKA